MAWGRSGVRVPSGPPMSEIEGFVYILQSLKNNRFYIGSTTNLKRRFEEHNSGKSKYTSESKPFILIFSQKYYSIHMARKAEYWLKSQKDKKFLQKIINQKAINKVFT